MGRTNDATGRADQRLTNLLMSKNKKPEAALFPQLRSYPAPWKGELVLVCSKCTRKWKKHGEKNDYIDVKKGLKSRFKRSKNAQKVRILSINCVKMCPKNAATVATQEQLGRSPAEVSIIRTEADLDALYAQLIRHTGKNVSPTLEA